MDIIYTNTSLTDVGVLHGFTIDHEQNTETENNTFEIQTSTNNMVMKNGCYWYSDDTEFGGKVDAIKIDTASDTVYYTGRTWFGILSSKILCPDSGSDYLTLSGDLNTIIKTILTRVNLTSLFTASTTTTKTVSFQFDRYCDALSGIIKMLSKNGYKLSCVWSNGKVVASAVPVVDYSTEMEMTDDLFDFTIQKDYSACNHMIGLGSGELKNRQVVHRYIDKNGNVSSSQYYTGLTEIVAIYDYDNAESLDDLTEKTEEQLAESAIEDSLEIKANDIDADVGDCFQATTVEIGISVKQYVTQKITTITDYDVTYQYSVGASMY